jgi:hypothetical protein
MPPLFFFYGPGLFLPNPDVFLSFVGQASSGPTLMSRPGLAQTKKKR